MEKERRKILLNKGSKDKHSHLIIFIDRSDFIPEEIIKYVERNENIKDVLYQYICDPNISIWCIYNYDMELEMQINEDRPYHITTPYNKTNEAYLFAEKKHKGQVRKDGSEYITHPIKVAEIVRQYFSNHIKFNELITAAYLHDVVEDTNTSIKEIREIFEEYVANLVNEVTNNNDEKHSMGKTNYLCNKLLNMSEDALNLKLCDRLANVLDLEKANPDFVEKYEIETTIILNYLLTNRKLTEVQMEIIKAINEQINNLRRKKILKLVKNLSPISIKKQAI